VVQPLEPAGDRVAGAELVALDGGADRGRELLEVRLHLLPQMTDDDHEVFGVQGGRGGDREAQHGLARDLVEEFRPGRLHSGSATCGKNNDGCNWRVG